MFEIIVACSEVIPVLAVFKAIAASCESCSASIAVIAVAFTAIPEISWSPVLVPERLFKLLISVAVKLLASLAVNTGSFSEMPPDIFSAVLA